MKKVTQILIILSVALMATACGTQPKLPAQSKSEQSKKVTEGNTFENIKKQGVLKIAVDDTFPPMEYRNDQNKLVGFDIDLANAISKELGVKVEFIPTAWDGILPGLDAKRYDIIMSSMNITDERKQKVDFVEYMKLGQVVAVKSGNPQKIQSKEDLSGKIVGVQLGSTSESAAKEIKGIKELKTYNGYTDVFNDLGLGRLQGVIVAEAVGRYYKTTKPDAFDVVGSSFQSLPVGIAVRKGDDELEAALQKAIETVKDNGAYTEVSKKWFGTDKSKE
ncbi:amino acid ABC transporter substrate-binding protein [Bacillus sp. ISL-40]|uniref:ABC transporter substrate-binding protein n=1 Tax=unclassified Bacillus (in: firmicutes) TaxID=185979 RepID=UPI001BEB91A0|nr:MULTISPECIES: ABC transporter substrate-binding protein [unclassified Bacillus (in: firmicutes)]MBT2698515.1 amino acid ABC transporter substrate-binding protein [Bacillus sp. ISL-40]MBT2720148.1 amino acid ABC transporter substrate-binding protein [Bacillus sp. ISL-46]MBT2739259.1 amino acid ABC transporter substrate-binding protein [Bacillus sp. ISL-77]